MTNTDLLDKKIKVSGLKKEYIAKQLGMSRAAFSAKLHGKTEFKMKDVVPLCTLLDLDAEERENIFFA